MSDILTPEPDFSSLQTTSQHASYLLLKGYVPGDILEVRPDAPKGRIWCRHCHQFLLIGAESVSHQNLVRPSQVCLDCGVWNYLDENLDIVHTGLCASPGGQRVKLAVGGSQARATVAPPRDATQEEAARFPYGNNDNSNLPSQS